MDICKIFFHKWAIVVNVVLDIYMYNAFLMQNLNKTQNMTKQDKEWKM